MDHDSRSFRHLAAVRHGRALAATFMLALGLGAFPCGPAAGATRPQAQPPTARRATHGPVRIECSHAMFVAGAESLGVTPVTLDLPARGTTLYLYADGVPRVSVPIPSTMGKPRVVRVEVPDFTGAWRGLMLSPVTGGRDSVTFVIFPKSVYWPAPGSSWQAADGLYGVLTSDDGDRWEVYGFAYDSRYNSLECAGAWQGSFDRDLYFTPSARPGRMDGGFSAGASGRNQGTITLRRRSGKYTLPAVFDSASVDPADSLAGEYAAALQSGQTALAEDRPVQAVHDFERALQAWPEDPEAHRLLGTAYDHVGNPTEAEKHYREALHRAPGNARALAELAGSLVSSGRASEASGMLYALRATWPDEPRAHFILGVLFANQGRFEESIDSFEKTIALAPQSPDARSARETIERIRARPAP